MKPLLTFLIASTSFPLFAFADYVPTSFADLAGTSEKIVVGTISKVEEETFVLKVDDLIFGAGMTGETITIRRFQDWPCAWRWSTYEVGQKVLVFLKLSKDDNFWAIRGAACEGESPVVEDFVYANFRVPGKSVKFGNNPFGKASLVAVPYDQLRSAILQFRANFQITPAKAPWRRDGQYSVFVPFDRIEQVENPSDSQFRPRRPKSEFCNQSPLHRQLVETVEKERTRIKKYNNR